MSGPSNDESANCASGARTILWGRNLSASLEVVEVGQMTLAEVITHR